MKMRKILAMLLAGTMVMSMGAMTAAAEEGETENAPQIAGNENASQKLVVWTLSNDLLQFADHFCEANPDVMIESVVIAPADYPTKIQAAMRGQQTEPDIIVGEPQMLQNMYEAGYFEDLTQDPYNVGEYEDTVVDYAWQVGQDADGIQRTIPYQITPSGIFYRRDIAKEVFGTDDPDEIGKLFADYDTIRQTGQTLKDAGYKIFASDGELIYSSGDSAWVVDDTLVVDQSRLDYMDLCVDLYKNDMTAYVDAWSTTWYQAMSGPIPVIDASTSVWDADAMAEAAESGNTTEVFAYGLPSWGVLTLRDNSGDLSGQWGVCAGPAYGFGGGTYLGINTLSERKDLAWDFIEFCTLNQDTLNWWIEKSQGDVVSSIPVLEAHKDDENPVYGGEKLYAFFLDQAKGIDYSKVTKYDDALKGAWGDAIASIKTGEMSKEDAIDNFYDVVESTYPELTVERP